MTDTNLLRTKIRDSGYRINFIAEKLGLSYYGFSKKVNNKSEFKAREIMALCALLDIDAGEREAIFFVEDVDKTATK